MNNPSKPAHSGNGEAQTDILTPDPAREALIQRKAAIIPESDRAGYLRAASGKASPRQAIKAFCLDCVAWDREQVRDCTGVDCPQFLYRPFQRREVQS